MVQAKEGPDTRLKRHSADDTLPAIQPESLGVDTPARAISRRAHELYERRGGEHGRDWEDWFQAEQEVRAGTTIES